jgi:hypothetical protein
MNWEKGFVPALKYKDYLNEYDYESGNGELKYVWHLGFGPIFHSEGKCNKPFLL